MRIDRRLNLIIPVEREGVDLYVHSMPISREVFERYFLPLTRTYANMYHEGLSVVAGPRVAAMLLRKIAKESGELAGPEGVEEGLIDEIKRLSNVVIHTGKGWEIVPLQQAFSVYHYIDEEEMSEVENALVFFTLASAIFRRKDRPTVFNGMRLLWGTDTTSLSCVEYVRSLPILTEADLSTKPAA